MLKYNQFAIEVFDHMHAIFIFDVIQTLFYSYVEVDRVSGFWSSLFVLSKVPELGDTIFIILRKQQLRFLHW